MPAPNTNPIAVTGPHITNPRTLDSRLAIDDVDPGHWDIRCGTCRHRWHATEPFTCTCDSPYAEWWTHIYVGPDPQPVKLHDNPPCPPVEPVEATYTCLTSEAFPEPSRLLEPHNCADIFPTFHIKRGRQVTLGAAPDSDITHLLIIFED